jgi:hypothetical protein
MSARGAREAGNFPAHRDRIEARVERIGNRPAQRADSPDPRAWRWIRVTQGHKTPVRPAATLPQWVARPRCRGPGTEQVHGLSCKLLISLEKELLKIQSI